MVELGWSINWIPNLVQLHLENMVLWNQEVEKEEERLSAGIPFGIVLHHMYHYYHLGHLNVVFLPQTTINYLSRPDCVSCECKHHCASPHALERSNLDQKERASDVSANKHIQISHSIPGERPTFLPTTLLVALWTGTALIEKLSRNALTKEGSHVFVIPSNQPNLQLLDSKQDHARDKGKR